MSAGLALTGLAALAWAVMDALRKALAARVSPLPLAGLLMLGQIPVYAIWALAEGRWAVGPGYWAPGAAAVLLNLVAQVLFVTAVRVSPLSRTVPMLAFTPVISVGTAALMLDERPGLLQGLGIAGVVLGAMVLQLRREDLAHPLAFARGLAREPGVPMMLGVSALWACTMVLDKLCLRHVAVPVHALLHVTGMALGVLALLALTGRLGELRAGLAHRGLLLAAVLVVGVATGAQLMAVREVLVSTVEAVKRAAGLTASVVNGRLVFGEPVTARGAGAVLIMALGVVAVVMG